MTEEQVLAIVKGQLSMLRANCENDDSAVIPDSEWDGFVVETRMEGDTDCVIRVRFVGVEV